MIIQIIIQLIKFISLKLVLLMFGSRWKFLKENTIVKDNALTLEALFNLTYNYYSAIYNSEGLWAVWAFRKDALREIKAFKWSDVNEIKGIDAKIFSEKELNKSYPHLNLYKEILTKIQYTAHLLIIVKAIITFLINIVFLIVFITSLYILVRKLFLFISVLVTSSFTTVYLSNNFSSVNTVLLYFKALALSLNRLSVKLHNFVFSDNLVSSASGLEISACPDPGAHTYIPIPSYDTMSIPPMPPALGHWDGSIRDPKELSYFPSGSDKKGWLDYLPSTELEYNVLYLVGGAIALIGCTYLLFYSDYRHSLLSFFSDVQADDNSSNLGGPDAGHIYRDTDYITNQSPSSQRGHLSPISSSDSLTQSGERSDYFRHPRSTPPSPLPLGGGGNGVGGDPEANISRILSKKNVDSISVPVYNNPAVVIIPSTPTDTEITPRQSLSPLPPFPVQSPQDQGLSGGGQVSEVSLSTQAEGMLPPIRPSKII